MNYLFKLGGLAALIDAATYLFGMAILVIVLVPAGFGSSDTDQLKLVAFLVENHRLMFIWNFVIFVVNAVFLAFLAVAIYQRLWPETPALAQLSLTFGTIWATLVLGAGMVANVGFAEVVRQHSTTPNEAAALWHIVHTIENGLGGGNEIAGGVWALILGISFLRAAVFPRLLAYFSLLIGLSGLSTVLPGMSDIGGPVFGIGFILWFIWVGVVLLRSPAHSQAPKRKGAL